MRVGAGKFVRKAAEAGAEHQRDFRAQLRLGKDVFRRALGPREFTAPVAGFERAALIAA